jgi:benzoate/toluate 1,2-dioxygenase subunit beta
MSADVAAFLFHEAELLDERRFQEWLALYTDDALYCLPQGDDPDPEHSVQIAHDDKRRMTERVLRLESGFAYSQDPPSRTVHLIGNVRVRGEVEGELDVASSLSIAEVRRGQQRVYYARVLHRLVDGGDGLRIRRKEVHLANSDLPLGNVTFLV